MCNRSTFAVLLALALAPPAAAAPAVGVTHATTKIRPDAGVPGATQIALTAAANEFEAFQIVVSGALTNVRATATALTGSAGTISAAELVLYRQAFYTVTVPSNTEGATGRWPDALIPAVDAYEGEVRNAFPFDVPSGEVRAIWVEVFVPAGTSPGAYAGSVRVEADGFAATVPVTLTVRPFSLPSTATLVSAFGVSWNVCAAHYGSYYDANCLDAGTERFLVLYGRAALDHRISLENVIYAGASGSDWSHFDSVYSGLFDGKAPTRLVGARQTTIRLNTGDTSRYQAWKDHFTAKGWADRLFQYTCDEPPHGCAFSEIPPRAAAARAAGIATLVTTDIDEMVAEGLTDDIDIVVPLVNFMHDKAGQDRRPEYQGFLAQPGRQLWMYQSCMSHGCGDGCVGTSSSYFTGWPSYMIDVSAVQNRAMEWISFRYDVAGELYFQTTHKFSAWEDQCDFSGNGDGTLFYPGTPARIGGTKHIPVESIRLKLIREGMEDYEYLHLLCELGDCAFARAQAGALFPTPYLAANASPDALYEARRQVAERIESLLAPVEPELLEVPAVTGAVKVDGDLGDLPAPALQLTAGAASAGFVLAWDWEHLYVGASVDDPDLWARGTGRDGELWDADGIEILLDPLSTRTASPDPDDRHVIVTVLGDVLDAAGAGAGEDRAIDLDLVTAARASGSVGDGPGDTGYTVELAIPWSALHVAPSAGSELGADLALNDATGAGVTSRDWADLTRFAQPARWNVLRLAGTPPALGTDGGTSGPDGGQPDAGTGGGDAGYADAGPDAGAPADASAPDSDAGTSRPDGAVAPADGGAAGIEGRGGCGCDAGTGKIWPALLVLIPALRRRRKAQCRAT